MYLLYKRKKNAKKSGIRPPNNFHQALILLGFHPDFQEQSGNTVHKTRPGKKMMNWFVTGSGRSSVDWPTARRRRSSPSGTCGTYSRQGSRGSSRRCQVRYQTVQVYMYVRDRRDKQRTKATRHYDFAGVLGPSILLPHDWPLLTKNTIHEYQPDPIILPLASKDKRILQQASSPKIWNVVDKKYWQLFHLSIQNSFLKHIF